MLTRPLCSNTAAIVLIDEDDRRETLNNLGLFDHPVGKAIVVDGPPSYPRVSLRAVEAFGSLAVPISDNIEASRADAHLKRIPYE